MRALQVLNLIHRSPSVVTAYSKQLHQPSARFSAFSFFRKKSADKDEAAVKSETKNLWSDAIEEFKQKNSLPDHTSPMSLTRKQLRAKKKQAFLHAIDVYLRRYGKTRRGYRVFAKNALEQMPVYEVTDDLDCYKAIIRLFPVGRMVVTTFLQAEFGHFMRQQDLMIELLVQMHQYHVIPDDEVGQMIIDVFGWRSHATHVYRELMYWSPKLANANPWPVQWKIMDDLDEDPLRLTRLIAERVAPDPNTQMHVIQMKTDTSAQPGHPQSMISAQSPEQRALLQYAIHNCKANQKPPPMVYIDGPNSVWYQRLQALYYTMWIDVDRSRIIHATKRVVFRELIKDQVDITQLPVFGHANPRLDNPVVPIALLAPPSNDNTLVAAHTDAESLTIPVDMNAATLQKPNSRVPRCQAEYDNRWQVLRQSHTYSFIPSDLTMHEQAEGTVLAVAVVTPIADALANQKTLYEGIIANELKQEKDTANKELRMCPPVPALAPSSLIRAWIKTLQKQNPCLSDTTVIIRASTMAETSRDNESSKEDHRESAYQ